MNREFVTAKEWQCLSIESRNAINAHWVEYHRLVAELEVANEDAKNLAIQLELEQNPGYSCWQLRDHYARMKGSDQ